MSTRFLRPRRPATIALALALTVTACGSGATPTPPPGIPSPAAGGPEPVIIDTDLSFDDILAIATLAREPRIDLRAVTVVGTGLVHCADGMQVVRDLLTTLEVDVPLTCGRSEVPAGGHEFPDAWREAADAGYGLTLEHRRVSRDPASAPALISRLAAASSAPVTLLALGPMTNVADALDEDPALAPRIARIVSMAGAVDVDGNVDLGDGLLPAEWNVYADPLAFDSVLRSGVEITLVPLDATRDVPLEPALLDTLAADHAAAPADIAYELVARHGRFEGEYLWDVLAAVVAVDESVVSFEGMKLAVVTTADRDAGRTVRADDGTPVRVAVKADRAAFEDRMLAALRTGAPRAHPFAVAGTLEVVSDGRTCRDAYPAKPAAGTWTVAVRTTVGPSAVVVVRLIDGSTWEDLVAWVATRPGPDAEAPAFVELVGYFAYAAPAEGRGLVVLEPGTYGVACLVGDAAAPEVVLGSGPIVVSP